MYNQGAGFFFFPPGSTCVRVRVYLYYDVVRFTFLPRKKKLQLV